MTAAALRGGSIRRFVDSYKERDWTIGPILGSYMDEKFVYHPSWAEKHAAATWEINITPGGALSWPANLVGMMEFEEEWYVEDACDMSKWE